MFTLKILTPPGFRTNKKVIDEIAKDISKRVSIPQKGVVNLVFVDPHSIKNLNNTYRKKDYATDVLSFHYFDDFSQLEKSDVAGEIVFCEEKILSQGQEYGLGPEKEFYKLLIHSLLHILGYDHESDSQYKHMKIVEKEVWDAVFNK